MEVRWMQRSFSNVGIRLTPYSGVECEPIDGSERFTQLAAPSVLVGVRLPAFPNTVANLSRGFAHLP